MKENVLRTISQGHCRLPLAPEWLRRLRIVFVVAFAFQIVSYVEKVGIILHSLYFSKTSIKFISPPHAVHVTFHEASHISRSETNAEQSVDIRSQCSVAKAP
jgi:hypothetical protein